VLGHYSNPDCRVDYSKLDDGSGSKVRATDPEDQSPLGAIKLHHGACDMNRQRMVGKLNLKNK
jgi:hypothetical protein